MRVAAFMARRWGMPDAGNHIDIQPLGGGLQSSVVRARIRRLDRTGFAVPANVIVKELLPGFEREARVYELLWRHLPRPPAVRVLGLDSAGHAMYLYLEEAQALSPWPWSDTASSAAVCRELARLHATTGLRFESVPWDYESELARSAQTTLALAENARDSGGRRHWRRLGDLRRVVAALPAVRARLLSGETTVIHGDMHPGNVILRSGQADVVLIDWARARIGSPFEDVASWLHSLGCWEPQARRRHDTLMRAYLEATRSGRRLCRDVRVDYWLASVSNGLSGAIRYHLSVLGDTGSAESARFHSGLALAAWERVVRRAAALVTTDLRR